MIGQHQTTVVVRRGHFDVAPGKLQIEDRARVAMQVIRGDFRPSGRAHENAYRQQPLPYHTQPTEIFPRRFAELSLSGMHRNGTSNRPGTSYILSISLSEISIQNTSDGRWRRLGRESIF